MNKAIFLDRDGTINEEVSYLKKPEQIKVIPGTIYSLRKFKNLGFLNIIITNQSGIARGILTENELSNIHKRLNDILCDDMGKLIDDIFYSPFHTEGIIKQYVSDSEFRKPNTGMILSAQSRHNINLEESYFIGDSFTDMKCADNAGVNKILVKTGYGKEDYLKCVNENLKIDYFAEDLLDASAYIEKLQNVR